MSTHTPMHESSRPFGQLWQVPIFFVGVLALILVAASAPWRKDPNLWQLDHDLHVLRQGLSSASEPVDKLIALSDNLLVRAERFPDRAGEIHYLAGRTHLKRALEMGNRDEADVHQRKARVHLDRALAIGVPEGDRNRLMYNLGVLVYQEGMDLPRAVELLHSSIEKGSDSPLQAYGLLIDAYMRLPTPDIEGALLANQKQLEFLGDDELGLAQARLMRGELLVRSQRWMDALKTLERIGPGAPSHLRLKARYLQTRCCEQESLWRKAIPLWKELLEDPRVVPGGKGHIYFALGACYASVDIVDQETALTCWKEALKYGGAEAQAAGLRIGEIYLLNDVPTSLDCWGRALGDVTSAVDFRNPYYPLEQLRELLKETGRQFLERQDYLYAQQTAELYRRVSRPGEGDAMLGDAAEALALQMREKYGDREDVRVQFRTAAKAYARAALVQPKEQQAALLWRSGTNYLPANDFLQAAAVLEKFVAVEKNDLRLAEGWLALAETRLALGNKDKAREAFYKCIEVPNTPFAYRARYQLALGELDHKNVSQAIAILDQNLGNGDPNIDVDAHEKSLYLLATVLFQEKEFFKASIRLKEAIRQYPENTSVLNVYDYLGECYRKLGSQAAEKLRANISQEVRGHYERKRVSWLKQSVETYLELADKLEESATNGKLLDDELVLLRKSLFGVADIYFEMNNIPEALRRYQILQGRYRRQVEGLIACQRIWLCVGRVIEPPDRVQQVRDVARAAVKLAQADLNAMSTTSPAFDGGPGVWRKGDWQNWLTWVEGQLNPAARSTTSQTKLIPITGP